LKDFSTEGGATAKSGSAVLKKPISCRPAAGSPGVYGGGETNYLPTMKPEGESSQAVIRKKKLLSGVIVPVSLRLLLEWHVGNRNIIVDRGETRTGGVRRLEEKKKGSAGHQKIKSLQKEE